MSIEINISNYESYLLSYIDGELNEAELTALELFLQQHPQIRQELDLLEGVRIVPDEQIVFDNKAALYRTGFAGDVDYEALLLGHIDGELTAAEEQTLQEYLRQHPAAQRELDLLQVVKLQPDTEIVFAHKAVLYRSSENKPAFVYRRMWWGAAAAAVIAGLVIWMLPSGNLSHQPPVIASAVKKTVAIPSPTPVTTVVTPVVPEVVQPVVAKNNKTTTVPVKKAAVAAPVKKQEIADVSAPRVDGPVMSQLPSPRNTMDEVVEKHLQQASTTQIVTGISAPVNKETVLAANMPATNNNNNVTANNIIAAPAQGAVKGELIMSVSGSDSKILDKVTNVAKFFSRKRNK
ncbi:hypothetical protein CLV51_101446 [Chitinophaga niastensis]|uniref:Uncharacterized protein n=1 Tax=Chitinophaga niastensis TaxID=536980 RepID=A0A2P8HSA9_CHINA|nr:hypothetical protein [Chitinophaga niastensis]PSL49116.1 hypothetical protein CLV51_101446 [Chitinophaga niastensis]